MAPGVEWRQPSRLTSNSRQTAFLGTQHELPRGCRRGWQCNRLLAAACGQRRSSMLAAAIRGPTLSTLHDTQYACMLHLPLACPHTQHPMQFRIPRVVGMLGSGLLLANVPGDVVAAFPPKWGVQLRAAALATIFLRCGLELEFKVGKCKEGEGADRGSSGTHHTSRSRRGLAHR